MLLSALFAVGLPAVHAQADKPTCAVLTFDARAGVSKDETLILTDRFAAELGRTGVYTLMTRSKMGEVLQLQKFARSDNCSATECAMEAGRMLAVQFMIYGSIGKVGQTFTVTANTINVESGAAEKTASVDQRGEVDGLLTTGMASLARRLVGQEEMEGDAPRSRGTGAAGETMSVDLGNGVKMELVWIPPGDFVMGSPGGEESRDDDEVQYRVTLTKEFWMGKYEVTQEQWQRVMGNNPSHFKGILNPVETVSWNDCQEFISRLNNLAGAQVTGRDAFRDGRLDGVSPSRTQAGVFRLPTEAEWEYACRAGTTTPFHYGNDLDSSMANFNGNYPYGRGSKGPYRVTTVPVGSFRPNAWGLCDMHGNVWEWCQDWYGEYQADGATDPTGPSSGSSRVLRGGSWDGDARVCRSASRGSGGPADRYDVVGFRVVVSR